MLMRVRPYLLLLGLGLLFFHDLVVHPGQILYADHSDLLDLHIPARRFLVGSLHQNGELPLWCPHQLAGAPFVHDIQAGIFYPPGAILYSLPEERVGSALSWLVVFHVLLAGWGMFAYARSAGLGEMGALVAGIGYMFAGRWLLHLLAAGHFVVVGLAWLPLVLWALEHSIRCGGLVWPTLAGGLYALLILGTQPQWTFYASLFIAAWSLGATPDLAGRWEVPTLSFRCALGRWVVCGLWMVLVGLGLSAVQLLPTAEAAGLALRSAGLGTSGALDGGLRSLLFLVGPALSTEPHNLEWEDRGGLTLLWLMAAVLAGLAGRGRVRFQACVALGFCLFAVGGSTLVQGLPGFNLFRQPPRMFIIVGFPVAFLAGHASELLCANNTRAAEVAALGRKALIRLLLGLGILVGGYVFRTLLEGRALRGHIYWLSLALTVPAAFALMSRRRNAGWAAPWVWAGLLIIDLWALTAPLVATRAEAELYAAPACLSPLVGLPLGQGRALDVGDRGVAFPLGGGAALARVHRLESLRGYNPLDYRRYKQYLSFVGGNAEPLVAMEGPLTYPVLGDFPVAHKKLLDLLNTRWLLQPADLPPPDGWQGPLCVDAAAQPYNFLAGGMPVLPPIALYYNPTALPRVFFVAHAGRLAADECMLDRLLETDFRKEVLLDAEAPALSCDCGAQTRSTSIRSYQPNRIDVTVGAGPPGWLIMTDLYYPGWCCRIDERPAEVLRADYVFRAVLVPEGAHELAFTFEPKAYRLGRLISLKTLAGVAVILALGVVRSLWRWLRLSGASRQESIPA
jgi:hypothetical protein